MTRVRNYFQCFLDMCETGMTFKGLCYGSGREMCQKCHYHVKTIPEKQKEILENEFKKSHNWGDY